VRRRGRDNILNIYTVEKQNFDMPFSVKILRHLTMVERN
jgi:hypothetical protein